MNNIEQYLDTIAWAATVIAGCALTWTIYLALCAFNNKLKEWKEKKSPNQKIKKSK